MFSLLFFFEAFLCAVLCLKLKENAPPYTGDFLNIHMITHTHDDIGWKETVDQYYINEVQWIFDTMIPILQDDQKKKFTYVEMAYFWRWWNEQNNSTKQAVLQLIDDGQLQINLGGWCMNDEANPTVNAIVHQMTDGNQFVLNHFGDNGRPLVAWHVDPFGHSWVTGGLWAEVGFDCFGIWRINYQELSQREATQNMEFIWKGSTSLGEDGYIFVHLLDSGYGTPNEIAFTKGNVFINVDPKLPTAKTNYTLLAQEFLTDARTRATWFRHNHLLIPYGGDFCHQNAYQTMIQMDELMYHINSNSTYNVSIFYSTLEDYTEAVNKLNLVWDVEDTDFFNYIDSAHAWWTGYFTSRPLLKLYIRSHEHELRVTEQFYVYGLNLKFSFNATQAMNNITSLRYAVDTAQHHDGITGTETTDVNNDYMLQLQIGLTNSIGLQDLLIPQFLEKDRHRPSLQRSTNIISELTENNYLVVVLYNSLAWPTTQVIQIPFNRSDVVVYDVDGNLVPSQITSISSQAHPFEYAANFSLNVLIVDLLPLAFTTYFVHVDQTKAHVSQYEYIDSWKSLNSDIKVGSGSYTLYFDSSSHLLTNISNNVINQRFATRNEWYQYVPSGGAYNDGLQNSGAYIFRPAQDNRYCLATSSVNNVQTSLVNREPFTTSSKPGYVVATHGSPAYRDVFIGTVCDIDIEGSVNNFTFQYYNIYENYWTDQKPYFDWMEFDSSRTYNQDHYLYNKTFNTVVVSSSSSSSKSVNITFPTNAFSTTPYLLVSVRSSNCSSYASFVTTITQLSNKHATISIRRADRSIGWASNIYLDWIAWENGAQYETSTFGYQTFTIPANTPFTQINFTFTNVKDFIVNEPVVLYSFYQTSPDSNNGVYYFASTAVGNDYKGFGLNIYAINPSSSDVTIKMAYWAFERNVLESAVAHNVSMIIQRGQLLDSVTQIFKDNYAQTFTVFNVNHTAFRYIDNQVHLGPIDQGSEFVTRFITSLNNNNTWYTNQNALEYVKRVYNPYIDERIAGNVFPCASQSVMKDINANYTFSTIVNMAHGVGSVRNGEYELMLHRRCLADDSRGVGQVLNETTHIEPSIYILLDDYEEVTYLNRHLMTKQSFRPTTFFGLTSSIQEYSTTYRTSFSTMGELYNTNGIPENVHLLSLRYAYSGVDLNEGLIMQFQQLFEVGENSKYSTNATIDINEIFNSSILTINQFTETTLTANLPLSELKRMQWNITDTNGNIRTINTGNSIKQRLKNTRDTEITLAPREIRTFVINEDMSRPMRSGEYRLPQYRKKKHPKKRTSQKKINVNK